MSTDIDKRFWSKISLFFLMITSLLGLIIRAIPLQNIIDNSYLYGFLQSHSHTGFLGWVFIAVYILILHNFGVPDIFKIKKTKIILSLVAFFIAGMTISFPFFGYNFISISFLSLFLSFSYYALFYLHKSIRTKVKNTVSYKFVKAGFYLYLLSSISPWALGPIMALGYKKTALYYNDIFFYLHFLYNGFVVFSIAGIFFIKYEIQNIKIKDLNQNLKTGLKFLLIGTILNYSESVLWTKPHFTVYLIAFISSVLLMLGVYHLWKSYSNIRWSNTEIQFPFIIKFALALFVVKIVLQMLQSFPVFASVSYDLKSYFIIGYIHLVTLGFITPILLALYSRNHLIDESSLYKFGLTSYIFGFFLTELLLFGQGLLLWTGVTFLNLYFNLIMLISSIFLFVGITIIYFSQKK